MIVSLNSFSDYCSGLEGKKMLARTNSSPPPIKFGISPVITIYIMTIYLRQLEILLL